MMAVARVSWEDCDETVLTAPAKIEDTSPSGARLRLKVPIEAGTKIQVSRCRDDFSGTAKWCRADEGEYAVGMRRGQVARPTPLRTAPQLNAVNPRPMETTSIVRADARRVREVEARGARPANEGGVREANTSSAREMDVPVEPAHIPEIVQNNSSQRPLIRRGTLIPIPKPAPLQLTRVTFPPAVMHEPMIGFEIARVMRRGEWRPASRQNQACSIRSEQHRSSKRAQTCKTNGSIWGIGDSSKMVGTAATTARRG